MNREDVINQAWAAACVACPDFRDLLEAQPQWNQLMQTETVRAVESILPNTPSTSINTAKPKPTTPIRSSGMSAPTAAHQPPSVDPNGTTGSRLESGSEASVAMPPPVAPASKRRPRPSRSRPRLILPKPPAASTTVTTPTLPNTPAPAAPNAATSQIVLPPAVITDPFLCIQDTFDNLIATQIQNPPNSTSTSSLALRRFLFRKLFCEHAFKELQALTVPVPSVDQLIPIISSACTKSCLLLM